jgi:acetyl-CoA acetyltransferase
VRRRRTTARRHDPREAGRARAPARSDGTVTAGNASGLNDGACALLLASDDAVSRWGLARARACSAWPPRACRRARWGSDRCRRSIAC